MNYSYEAIDTSIAGLESLSKFLAKTFNSYKFTPDYLDWMYNKNPNVGWVRCEHQIMIKKYYR